jgi:potassium-transporting ATPase KdpC subunit
MQHVRPALMMTLLFTLLLGLAYPLAMTGVAGLIFPNQAGGSLVRDSAGQVVGSSLIAQGFAKPEYLHPRASAAGNGYDPMSSGGSQLGPLDQKLIDRVKTDSAAIRKADGPGDIPADAVTISGSGLDPDISPENAQLQAARIAKARGMTQSEALALISAHTDGAFLGFIGQPHVNVLAVNRALDARYPVGHPKAS